MNLTNAGGGCNQIKDKFTNSPEGYSRSLHYFANSGRKKDDGKCNNDEGGKNNDKKTRFQTYIYMCFGDVNADGPRSRMRQQHNTGH